MEVCAAPNNFSLRQLNGSNDAPTVKGTMQQQKQKDAAQPIMIHLPQQLAFWSLPHLYFQNYLLEASQHFSKTFLCVLNQT